jgi:hypothetical protein
MTLEQSLDTQPTVRMNATLHIVICLIMLGSASGCAVREHYYVCIPGTMPSSLPDNQVAGVASSDQEEEMLLTPTSLRIASQTYRFKEEQARIRLYVHPESGSTVQFDPFSNRLTLGAQHMLCRRLDNL